MLLSEEEAKTKWCPYARVIFDEGGAGNRWPGSDDNSLLPINSMCLGSGCMSWRWGYHRDGMGDKKGYCGLAGDPDRDDEI